jgi:small subunit ribosomal protein S21
MTYVKSRDGEPFDILLKRFRKRVGQDGIRAEMRKRRYFVTKGEQERIDKKKGIQRSRRKLRRRHS